jgi:Bacterial SH3 domain
MNRKTKRVLCWLPVAVTLVIWLSACPSGPEAVQQPAPPPSATAEAAQPPTLTPVPPTPVPPTATVPPSPEPTATQPAPTATPIPPSPTSTPVPPTETPTVPPPTETPAPAVALKKPTLNVRGGPGTNYAVIGALKQGDRAAVTGRSGDCAWLQVTTAAGLAGWIAGGADYVTLNVPCASVPEAKAPPPPTRAPTRPAPAATPTVAAAKGPSLPTDKGCFLFISYIGDPLKVTITAQDRQWNMDFELPPMGEYLLCMDPGHYTYSLNHAKWVGHGEFDVEAGKHYRFPIEGRT